jgi:phospholipase/carboxylesterase
MSNETYHALTKAPKPGAPLVFAFHGTGGDENQFFDLAQQLLPGAGVVSPRGDVSEMGAARFFRRTGEGVYDMEDLARRTGAMAEFVQRIRPRTQARRSMALATRTGQTSLPLSQWRTPICSTVSHFCIR